MCAPAGLRVAHEAHAAARGVPRAGRVPADDCGRCFAGTSPAGPVARTADQRCAQAQAVEASGPGNCNSE